MLNMTERFELVHTKYDYSKVEYINSKTKICIICPEHGDFWQKPLNHVNKKTAVQNVQRLLN